MSLELEVEGQPYTQFVSGIVEIRLDALSNTFSFEAVSTAATSFPFKGGESCRVLVDGEAVLTGRIEIVRVDYTANSHSILIEGRDKTGDLLDSNLDTLSDLSAPLGIKEIVEKVLESLELDIEVIELTPTDKFNAAEDIVAPEPGENAYEFLERYTRKRQVLLTSNGEGNIVITQSSGISAPVSVQNIIGANNNNILQGSVSYDTTGRFNIYKFSSGLNPSALNLSGVFDLTASVDQSGKVLDKDVRKGRQLILVAETPNSNDQNLVRSQWEANIRKARGRTYAVKLDGFRDQENNLWDINKLITVNDEFAGINAQMLVNSVSFSLDESEGSMTNLSLLESNAYTLELEEPQTEDTGSEFSL